MKKNAIIAEILIWILILAVIICGAGFLYHQIYVKPNVYSIKFKDIDGITKGSPVRFMGINVGHVRKLASVDKSIVVQIIITKKDLKIPPGTIARVEFYGLGGSKSIELMPSDGTSETISTTDTIRIADVARQARSLVAIIEIIEKFARSLDRNAIQSVLETVGDTSPDKIKQFEADMNKFGGDINIKVNDIKDKQSNMAKTIDKANSMVVKLNKFVKK